jgi:hypothetical protein
MKKFILIAAFVMLFGCSTTFAQSKETGLAFHWMNVKKVEQVEVQQSSNQDQSDELKTQAQILAELKASRAIIASQNKQITALEGQVSTKDQLISVITEQKDFYKQAASERKTAGTLDDQNILLLRQQIAEDRQEIKDLRNENDKLRSSRDTRTLFGGLIGLGLGYAAHK